MKKVTLTTPERIVNDGEFYVSSGRLFRWDASAGRGVMVDTLDQFRNAEDRAV